MWWLLELRALLLRCGNQASFRASTDAARITTNWRISFLRVHPLEIRAIRVLIDGTASTASGKRSGFRHWNTPHPMQYEAIFNQALEHHRLGRLEQAERLYRRVIGRAPEVAEAHANLGVVLRSLGRPDEAVACYRRALALRPDFAEAQGNLGVTEATLERIDAAVAAFHRAVLLRPEDREARANLATALATQAERRRSSPVAAAVALLEQGNLDQAITEFRHGLALEPGDADSEANLGVALAAQQNLDDAAAAFRRAIVLKPDHPAAWSNLAVVLPEIGQPKMGLAAARRTVALAPDSALAYANLARGLNDLERTDQAIESFRRAVLLEPNDARLHADLAMTLLAGGRFYEGWEEYEWRWRGGLAGMTPRTFVKPLWRGESLAGLRILLHSEQGLGDTLQFCRYAPILAESGARVIVEVPAALARLVGTLPGVERVIVAGEAPPPFDCHLPLLSLPFVMGTTIETIPSHVPYLHPVPNVCADWSERLAGLPGCRVGLVWAGRTHLGAEAPVGAAGPWRNLTLDRLKPLFEVSGVSLVSLQYGPAAAELTHIPAKKRPLDPMGDVTDFADTAALVANLDLIITVDTAVAHLAGALGKPVWILSRYAGCWRWLRGRDDSPWYPTARLFRQNERRDWDEVIDRVARALRSYRKVHL